MAAEKQTTKKLHHFVPQAYLRGFANEKERLTAVRLPGDHSFTTIVRNVAAQMHFHRVEGLDKPDEFEDVLASIEGEAQAIIRKLERRGGPRLTDVERHTFAFYIALQAVRGPETRRTSETMRANIVRIEVGAGGRRNVGAWAKENLGFEPNEEQEERIWQEATQEGGPPIALPNVAHIKHMMHMAEHLTKYVLARPWVMVHFTKRSLITSDAPVSLVRKPDDDAWMGVGFATAAFITFPLTRRLGLLMGDPMKFVAELGADDPKLQVIGNSVRSGKFDLVQEETAALAKFFNEHTTDSASQYLFHHPDDQRYVPEELPEPHLVTMSMNGGLTDVEWDGTPMFGPASEE
ncbi:hypothetical protein L1277_000404 [Okibacterium sp. HSC-33S16]|uniref:DUF4238 domain-containing protein n=1 Tax=Okibacterium sp. HSC-33S16 TaxID=2910965 RepID=UPI0020A0EF59|nr:DUF4238 domain-containing protein [Okibacterium sp. HSC-33S16]MCP2030340.1 hypothetical protein [Okibacterium sp. HSC-33S16]